MSVCAVTGASGFLGSYVAEQLKARGAHVRALVRPQSDTAFLSRLAVELLYGDLRDPKSLRPLVAGADVVYHCAAQLGDWGPWSKFEQGTVLTTRHLVNACQADNAPRLLHVSSVAAYGHPLATDKQIDEESPLGQHLWLWDHYARSKMQAEREAARLGDRVTIVRPTWIYGPRDRVILPRIVSTVRAGRARLIGSGENRLNMVHAADMADGVVRAATHPAAGGRIYNLTSDGDITQRGFYDLLCDELELPRVERNVPRRVADIFGFACEICGRAIGQREPPRVTRHGISLLSRSTNFSNQRAREELGWHPAQHTEEGLREALRDLNARTTDFKSSGT